MISAAIIDKSKSVEKEETRRRRKREEELERNEKGDRGGERRKVCIYRVAYGKAGEGKRNVMRFGNIPLKVNL